MRLHELRSGQADLVAVERVSALVPAPPTGVGIQSSGTKRLSQSFTSVALATVLVFGQLAKIHQLKPTKRRHLQNA